MYPELQSIFAFNDEISSGVATIRVKVHFGVFDSRHDVCDTVEGEDEDATGCYLFGVSG